MKNKLLSPDEIMKLYPIEKIKELTEPEKLVLIKYFCESLIVNSNDKEKTKQHISNTIDVHIRKN